MKTITKYMAALLLLASCYRDREEPARVVKIDMPIDNSKLKVADTLVPDDTAAFKIVTGYATPQELVSFAQTLKGIPYEYASCSKEQGFDCSGFVYYVFSNFNIDVPRSSRDYTNVGKEVALAQAKPGDLILFTGTDPADRTVGHMGIVTINTPDSLLFIHSSSGEANGVTTSKLDEHYQKRFVKVTRVFVQNEKG